VITFIIAGYCSEEGPWLTFITLFFDFVIYIACFYVSFVVSLYFLDVLDY
jgi:hypothetical protein